MIDLKKTILLIFVTISLMKEVNGYRLSDEQKICVDRLLVIFNTTKRDSEDRLTIPKLAYENITPDQLKYENEEDTDPFALFLYNQIYNKITASGHALALRPWCEDYCNNVIHDPSEVDSCVEIVNEYFPNDNDPTTMLKHGYISHTKDSFRDENYPESKYFYHLHSNIPFKYEFMTITEVCQGLTQSKQRKGTTPYKKQEDPSSTSGNTSSFTARNKRTSASSNVVPYEELYDLIL